MKSLSTEQDIINGQETRKCRELNVCLDCRGSDLLQCQFETFFAVQLLSQQLFYGISYDSVLKYSPKLNLCGGDSNAVSLISKQSTCNL